jgi:hypothetical protein
MTNPVPEMPDCRRCVNSYHRADDGRLDCDEYCVNGIRYHVAEPIRLYTITSADGGKYVSSKQG